MKRFITLAVVLLASVLMFSSCEKHAYTTSTNIFKVSRGSGFTAVRSNLSIKLGSPVYIIATEEDGTHFDSGVYSADVTPVEDSSLICAEAEAGKFKGEDCLVLKGTEMGQSSVTLKFDVNGFLLHKTITLTVK
ncbi:MAG: hypothetical protein K6A64_10355 [Bacteroidales bacterium]|nr:hypothetical protein [Bacteroidales bacterium]